MNTSELPIVDLTIDRIPIACACFDAHGNLITGNKRWFSHFDSSEIFKVSQIRSCIGFDAFLPTCQPCGTPSKDYLRKQIKEALSNEECLFYLYTVKPNGDLIYSKITLQCETADLVIACAQESIQHKVTLDSVVKNERKKPRYLEQFSDVSQFVLDSTPIAITLYDKSLSPIDCNIKAVKMYGALNSEEYLEHFFSLMDPCQHNGENSQTLLKSHILKAFEEGYSHLPEFKCFTMDGASIIAEYTFVRIHHNDDLYVIEYASDVTKKKKSMEIERENEINDRVKLMFDTAPLAIEYWDINCNPIDCNRTALDLYGFSNKEDYQMKLKKATTFTHPDGICSWEIWVQHINEIFETGTGSFEYIEQNVKGELSFARVDGIRIKYNDEFVVITYSNDISELKEQELIVAQTQQALNYREKLLHTVNLTAEVLLTANEESTMSALFSGMEIVGRCVDVDRVQIWRNEVIDGELYFVMRYEWLSELGKEKIEVPIGSKTAYSSRPGWLDMFLRGEYINGPISQLSEEDAAFMSCYEMISIVILPLFLNKEFIGFFSVDDCMFERTFSDDEMDMFASVGLMFTSVFNKSEQAVKINETNRQLESALKQALTADIAEKSSMAKSRFLARMSHEIRTPITAVLGIAEIQLQNMNLSSHIEEAFAKIHNAASLLLGIINDILDLSKIEAGKMELLQEQYDVASMISDITHLNFRYLSNKDVKFNLYVDENLPSYLIGDVLRIEQIMNNLLSNAFKYTESGSVELSVKCHENGSEEDFMEIVVSICDTGFGMTKEQIDALYNDYTRFHEHGNRIISGTGLGMPIVYNLAQLMGAKIDVKSEVGKGTNVVVSIPQKISGSGLLGSEAACRLQRFEENINSYTKKFNFVPSPMPYGSVLVVDDIETNLYVAQGLLGFYALNVEVCNCGYDAINKIKQGKIYDIVFMDHMMPGLNGTETMKIMRKMGYTQPIIVLTADALIGQAEEFVKSGFDGFISKPIQTKILNNMLVKYIKDKQPKEVILTAEEAINDVTFANNKGINDYLTGDALITKLRADFAKSYKNTVLDIKKALDENNIETAHLLAHSLKGLAGLIGENNLVHAAEKVERLISAGDTHAIKLDALEYELKNVLRRINIAEPTIFTNAKYADKDKALEIFDQLISLLGSYNAESLNYLEDLRRIPETCVLVRQIEKFDFTNALITTNVLIEIFE